jgi:hypothetical protein
MTYSIFSTESGNLIDSYSTRARAYEAISKLAAQSPRTLRHVALIEFDDAGAIVATHEGEELVATPSRRSAPHGSARLAHAWQALRHRR